MASKKWPTPSIWTSVPPPEHGADARRHAGRHGGLQAVNGQDAPLELARVARFERLGDELVEAVDVDGLAGVAGAHRRRSRARRSGAWSPAGAPSIDRRLAEEVGCGAGVDGNGLAVDLVGRRPAAAHVAIDLRRRRR